MAVSILAARRFAVPEFRSRTTAAAGTADSHWRESTFQTELMTGFVNTGGMPLSAITVGSLQDMGYIVNMLAADPFQVPLAGASANTIPGDGTWEMRPPSPGVVISPNGVVTPIKRP